MSKYTSRDFDQVGFGLAFTSELAKRVKAFLDAAQAVIDKNYREQERPYLRLVLGRQYIRVVRVTPDGADSTYGFIVVFNGDLVAKTFNDRPAKRTRGNIFCLNRSLECLTAEGIA